jgi:hypothetical protein
VEWVKSQGGKPFLVPAIGSHGGATSDGQVVVLTGYGITEATMGAPVRSSIQVVELPTAEAGIPIYFDAQAFAADGTIVLNHVKPHTSFYGTYESGLMKMLAIGLGKHRQALAIHAYGIAGLRTLMPRVAKQILRHANILLGVAVVENAYDETMLLRALPASEIPAREPELLQIARANMSYLPVDDIDILVVDEIGKNISGLGMDPNIIGRLKIVGQPEPTSPCIKVIIVLYLSAATQGNAVGMGLADIMLRRAAEKINFAATYANVVTTGFLERAKLPVVAESDAESFRIAC